MVNLLFKLDLLEAHYLKRRTRFQKSRAILKSKKNHKLIPLDLKKPEQESLIKSIKAEIFQHKLHYALTTFQRTLKKLIKSLKIGKKTIKEELEFLQSLDIERISKIRVLKIVSKLYNLKKEEFSFVEKWVAEALQDQSNNLNPSKFYNGLTNDQRNWYSKLMNDKDLKSLNEQIELSLKLILGPVEKTSKKDQAEVEKLGAGKDNVDESESDSDRDSDSDGDSDSSDNNAEVQDVDSDEEDYNQYDKLVIASDNEDEEVEWDNTIDYNQVTDEEPSEDEGDDFELKSESEDDFFDKPEPKKEKKEKKEKKDKKKKDAKLPSLMQGYISADDDSDPDGDEVVESITKPQKKNRRGQRARQKIWEQKYGGKANHVKKEWEKKKEEREKKQKEWEGRERKRQEKVMKNGGFASGENMKPLGIRGSAAASSAPLASTTMVIPAPAPVHPSWEAKLRQKEALKNVKFEGKKVKFD